MQIDRLLEILLLLLKFKKTTAGQLADRFQVSIRTIYRDIDALSLAGIPVYCVRGNEGGVFLDNDYILERNFLTKTEREQMETALHLLKSTNLFKVDQLLHKYTAIAQYDTDWISLELNEFDKSSGSQEDFLNIKKALTAHCKIRFIYHSRFGQTQLKTVSPAQIVYRQSSWNLLGYCNDNLEYQIYPLHSIRDLTLLEELYTLPEPIVLPVEDTVTVRLKFSKRLFYKMYDDFSEKDIHKNADGSYEVELNLLDNESLYSYLLSFGSNVEILSPLWLKQQIVKKLQAFLENNQI